METPTSSTAIITCQISVNVHTLSNKLDNDQHRIISKFKWIELLILYLPSWTTKLPNNKQRNKFINIIGLLYVLASISFIIFTMVYEVITNPGRYTLATIVAGLSQGGLMIIFKIVSVYYFIYRFNFDWYILLNNTTDIRYAMRQVNTLNLRLITMFLMGVMCAIYVIILFINHVRKPYDIIYTAYMLNIGFTAYVFQLSISVLLLKYKLYLNELKYNMMHVEDEIVGFELDYTQMRDKMLKDIKPLQIYFILYFVIVITAAWLTAFGVIDDSLEIHYSGYPVFYTAVLLPLLEFCISSGLIAHQYSLLLIPYNKEYKLSDQNMVTVDLILHRKPMIIQLLGIECTWQNFTKLLFTAVLSKVIISGFKASL